MFRILAADEIEFRIDVSAAEWPIGIVAIVVLVALLRWQEVDERHHLRVNRLCGFFREPAHRSLSFRPLSV